ncbi:hypothetical protein VINI7043_13326 [Vibrio nigripulchritudo ATCC 27043]|nr:hypothetical protein VINI7043_13326 [Vibrio nigripulchritudo ATCC 27043]
MKIKDRVNQIFTWLRENKYLVQLLLILGIDYFSDSQASRALKVLHEIVSIL